MTILIDGYNLLHAAGIIPRGVGRGTLERARRALLNWLVASLEPKQVAETTIVFDAANPPPGRPRQFEHEGLTVLFSSEHENADAMLEELIKRVAVPKRLVVVSSDHRVQRAARRRRATAVDSDVWYVETRRKRNSTDIVPPAETKPSAPLSATEVQHWLDEFSDLIDDLDTLDETNMGGPSTPANLDHPTKPKKRQAKHITLPVRSKDGRGTSHDEQRAAHLPTPEFGETESDETKLDSSADTDSNLANPFPPGYGEDLLRPDADLDDL